MPLKPPPRNPNYQLKPNWQPRMKIKGVPREQKIFPNDVYQEVSVRTGYSKKDIKAVVNVFHRVIADEFAAGKLMFLFSPFYVMILRKYSARVNRLVNGETRTIPEHRKIAFRSYSALDEAVGYESSRKKSRRESRKKGLKK